MGPLGFWDGVQSAPDENFTINGFGSLYLELKETLKNTVLGQGVVEQYLPDQKSFQIMAATAEISNETANFIWEDQLYGLSNPDNSLVWIDAANNGVGSNESNHLQNYFQLSSLQIQFLLSKIS